MRYILYISTVFAVHVQCSLARIRRSATDPNPRNSPKVPVIVTPGERADDVGPSLRSVGSSSRIRRFLDQRIERVIHWRLPAAVCTFQSSERYTLLEHSTLRVDSAFG